MDDAMLNHIISLSAVCVTLLLGIAGLIVNSLIQRRSNSIQIITQCRLKRRERTQGIVSDLLKYSDLSFVSALTDIEKTQTAKEIVGLVSELRALYSFSFDKDIRLVTAAFEIKELLCNYLLSSPKLPLFTCQRSGNGLKMKPSENRKTGKNGLQAGKAYTRKTAVIFPNPPMDISFPPIKAKIIPEKDNSAVTGLRNGD